MRIGGVTPAKSPFSLQVIDGQPSTPKAFAENGDARCLASSELHQEGIPCVTNLEEGAIEPMQKRGVLRYRDQMIRHLDVATQLIDERVRALSLAQEGFQRPGAHAPGLAGFQADEAPFPTPAVDRRRLHTKPRGNVIHT
jgi:hypothetical protein